MHKDFSNAKDDFLGNISLLENFLSNASKELASSNNNRQKKVLSDLACSLQKANAILETYNVEDISGFYFLKMQNPILLFLHSGKSLSYHEYFQPVVYAISFLKSWHKDIQKINKNYCSNIDTPNELDELILKEITRFSGSLAESILYLKNRKSFFSSITI